MDYRNNSGTITGGSDGCVNFNDPDNKGLATCLTASGIQSVYNEHCHHLSLADFIVLSSEAVTIRTASRYDANNKFGRGTLGSRFANRFKVGRNTSTTCTATGLMPDGNDGCTGLKNIFLDHIYNKSKNEKGAWRLVAAISGAHTLGQAKVENSGFNGHWSDASNQGKFNNDYYRSMLLKGWGPELGISTGNDQWQRIDQFNSSGNVTHKEMMLNSDICLAYNNNSAHDACVDAFMANTTGMTLNQANGNCRGLQRNSDTKFLLANQSQCCAWTNTKALKNNGLFRRTTTKTNNFCGQSNTNLDFGTGRAQCCGGEGSSSVGDCDSAKWPKGPAFRSVLTFAANEGHWLR